jgi:SAM-dependent methyltransferase
MTGATDQAFLGFYGNEEIIPTRQILSSKERFFDQRDYLFRTLGVPPSFITGKRVLEIGPGTGQKAQHLLAYDPDRYVAVDGNDSSLRMAGEAIRESGFAGSLDLRKANFTEYEDVDVYDLVLAESLVPTQINPGAFLARLRSFVEPAGGVLIYTCMDAVSLVSEMLRRCIVRDRGFVTDDLQSSAERIAAFFQEDLDSLPGMDRVRTDWAIDQMIHPWSGPLLDIPTSLLSMSPGTHYLGSSPRLSGDGRWYKSPEVSGTNSIDWAVSTFWKRCHYLVDHRLWSDEDRTEHDNRGLYRWSQAIYDTVMHGSWTRADRESIKPLTRNLLESLPDGAVPTSRAIEAFLRFWDTDDVSSLVDFRPWWGRGQQYVAVAASGRPTRGTHASTVPEKAKVENLKRR